ncbi:sulfotransferase family protein [Shimia isoporae]|uniref:Sulfotransferase family protein n=1 Tax=Shimia isoporae TaxID=647720 RepID=A0A4R1NLG6_9RHOB|nr:sulfotransferase family 2 domain-containing protein [Shimia isoporae]TCL09207.1 sulfotransferase family protein [Shimia isoporae]
MIISHKFKFVFIRPMKVGGTSTEIAMMNVLRAHSDKSEIVSQPPHYNVAQVMSKYGEEVVDYRFYSVVRNPWDRAVSMFFHRNRLLAEKPQSEQVVAFREWITSGAFLFDERGSIFDTTGSLYWRGFPIVDHVIRYDRLAEGLRKLSRQMELPKKIDISELRERGNDRPQTARDFAAFYDKESWQAVRIAAAKDCATFGYSASRPEGGNEVMVHFNSRLIRHNILGEKLIRKALG